MSTVMTYEINSESSATTEQFARTLGSRLKGGEVIVLVSDLGGGKTTFVRGLAAGMGSSDKVHSPSFTLNNEYHASRLTLHHFDFYRLADPGILRREIAELLEDDQSVIAVEWAEIVEDVLPPRRLTVHIRATGENERHLTLEYPKDLSYLLEER